MAAASRACVLAAGKGTRMGGDRPKVLFEAAGKPLIHWTLSALSAAGLTDIVCVVGYGKDDVVAELPTGVRWVEQSPQLGTGHAVMCVRSLFGGEGPPILVAYGDMPLIRAATYEKVAEMREAEDAACVVLTVRVPSDSRFGRIVRDADGKVERIVEYKDADQAERAIDEGNTGIYCFRAAALWAALAEVGNENAQGEYYLTDVVQILLSQGETVTTHLCEDEEEGLGVNTPEDLQRVSDLLQARCQDSPAPSETSE